MAATRKRLLVVGEQGCGKTSLQVVFSKHEFPNDYILRKIYGDFSVDMEVDGKQVKLELLDTKESYYKPMRQHLYRYADVVLMCFSVDSPDSLKSISEKWVPEARDYCPNIPIILVANKMDLRNDVHIHNKLSQMKQEPVCTEDGRALAIRIAAYEYLECSAKTKEGVSEVLETAARVVLREMHEPSEEYRSCCKLL